MLNEEPSIFQFRLLPSHQSDFFSKALSLGRQNPSESWHQHMKQSPDDNGREFPYQRHDVAFSREIQEKKDGLNDHQKVQDINKHHISIKAAKYKRNQSYSPLHIMFLYSSCSHDFRKTGKRSLPASKIRIGEDGTGPDNGPDHGLDHGSDQESDHGSDHGKSFKKKLKKTTPERSNKIQIVYKTIIKQK